MVLVAGFGCDGSGGVLAPPPVPTPLTLAMQAGLMVTPDASDLDVGSTVQLEATVGRAGDPVLGRLPITWESSDPSIASVDPATGLVTALAPGGPVVITARLGQGPVSGTALVTVSGHQVTLRLYSIDDHLEAFLTNSDFAGTPILAGNYFEDTGHVDITSLMRPGSNTIELELRNDLGGWTYGYELKIDGNVVWSGQCGTTGVFGCADNDGTLGIVFTDTFTFDWPPEE